jgi:hypothetical protein
MLDTEALVSLVDAAICALVRWDPGGDCATLPSTKARLLLRTSPMFPGAAASDRAGPAAVYAMPGLLR